jgi:hypothetical protein
MSSSSPSSPQAPIPKDLKPVKRRTKFMIAQENKQILDYICAGQDHDQIRRRVGLSERNYWKRIAAIRKRDLELTKAQQTPEAHAFLYRYTECVLEMRVGRHHITLLFHRYIGLLLLHPPMLYLLHQNHIRTTNSIGASMN